MDKKKILFIVGIILIVILGIIAINISKKNSKPTEEVDNLNKNVLKDTNIENFELTDQSVITRDGLSTYMANLTNKTNEVEHIDYLYLIFTIDNEDINVIAAQDTDINAGSKLPIMISFDRDISKATKVTYELTKEKK